MFENDGCEEVWSSIFWAQRRGKREHQMKGCVAEQKVSDWQMNAWTLSSFNACEELDHLIILYPLSPALMSIGGLDIVPPITTVAPPLGPSALDTFLIHYSLTTCMLPQMSCQTAALLLILISVAKKYRHAQHIKSEIHRLSLPIHSVLVAKFTVV